MSVPELDGPGRTLYAKAGFNVIATANTRDRGVNDMSAALKRRFNFETVQPIGSIEDEMGAVQREAGQAPPARRHPHHASTRCGGTARHDVPRASNRADQRWRLEPLTTAMSTAEAVSTAYAAGIHAYYYGENAVEPEHLVQHLVVGSQGRPGRREEARELLQPRGEGPCKGSWPAYYEARKHLP
ncbi:MAG: AAA family ATPase [Mesorhizobium sp.]